MYPLIKLLLGDYSKEELAKHFATTKNQITRWNRTREDVHSEPFFQYIQEFVRKNKRWWLSHLAKGRVLPQIRQDTENIVVFDPEWLFAGDKVIFVGNMWLEFKLHSIADDVVSALKHKRESCPQIVCIGSGGAGTDAIVQGFLQHIRIHLRHFQVDENLLKEKLVILKTPETVLMSPSAFIGIANEGWLEAKSVFTGKKNQMLLIPTSWAFFDFKHGYLALVDKGKLGTVYGKEGFVNLDV